MEKLFTGKTIDDAIAAACADLGKNKEDFAYEIVEYPNKGFLGIGAKPAEIRVNIPEPAPERPPRERSERPMRERRPERTARPERTERPEKRSPEHYEKAAKEFRERRATEVAPKPNVEEKPIEKKPVVKKDRAPLEGDSLEVEKFLNGLFDLMKISADDMEINIEEGKYIKINLTGDELSLLTRKQGEAADAVQLMTSLFMNRKKEQYYKATVNVNNFREQSIERLERLAMKTANQVLKTKKRMTLRPMTAFQRRVIHAKLQEVDKITTHSVGEEPNRRVVVSYQWPDKKPVQRAVKAAPVAEVEIKEEN